MKPSMNIRGSRYTGVEMWSDKVLKGTNVDSEAGALYAEIVKHIGMNFNPDDRMSKLTSLRYAMSLRADDRAESVMACLQSLAKNDVDARELYKSFVKQQR